MCGVILQNLVSAVGCNSATARMFWEMSETRVLAIVKFIWGCPTNDPLSYLSTRSGIAIYTGNYLILMRILIQKFEVSSLSSAATLEWSLPKAVVIFLFFSRCPLPPPHTNTATLIPTTILQFLLKYTCCHESDRVIGSTDTETKIICIHMYGQTYSCGLQCTRPSV